MAKSKTKQPRSRLVTAFGYLYWLLIVIAIIYFLVDVWRIESVQCLAEGQEVDEICEQLSTLENSSLFFTNLQQSVLFKNTLKNKQGQVFQPVNWKKILPNRLIITFKKEDPEYFLVTKQGQYLVNDQHSLTAADSEFDLKVVEVSAVYSELIHDQNRIDPNLNQNILSLIAELDKTDAKWEKIILDQQHSQIAFDNYVYIFGFEQLEPKRMAIQIQLLEETIADTFLPEQVKEVDLRFELPVIRTTVDQPQVMTPTDQSNSDESSASFGEDQSRQQDPGVEEQTMQSDQDPAVEEVVESSGSAGLELLE